MKVVPIVTCVLIVHFSIYSAILFHLHAIKQIYYLQISSQLFHLFLNATHVSRISKRNLIDTVRPEWKFLNINNIISRRRFSNINNIIPNCFARLPLFAVASVKEFKIRLPSGLLNVNSLPTYFQLTSNQQALFQDTNNSL